MRLVQVLRAHLKEVHLVELLRVHLVQVLRGAPRAGVTRCTSSRCYEVHLVQVLRAHLKQVHLVELLRVHLVQVLRGAPRAGVTRCTSSRCYEVHLVQVLRVHLKEVHLVELFPGDLLPILFQKTSVVCRWQTHTMRCITANMLQTKVTTIATVDVFELQRVICRKSPILTYPTCIWHLHWGVTPFELCPDIWQEKTTVRGLSCGIVCVILHLAVSVEHRLVIDGRTMMAYTALTWCRAVETFETKSQ